MKHKEIPFLTGFSKLNKQEKLKAVAGIFANPEAVSAEFQSFWHPNEELQSRFDEFSENTISNFVFPFGVVPNFMLNGKCYLVPMVIEESSVVAAASKSAKFWADKGGFRSEIVGTEKLGQVHFIWNGEESKLTAAFPEIRERMLSETAHITDNMRKRGGGITNIELVNRSNEEPGYFQFKARFETCDSMGANFINSCLEEFASIFRDWCEVAPGLTSEERTPHIIMSILSNYTPQCLVKAWVECPLEDLGYHENMAPAEFAWKFGKAVRVAQLDVHRATTHNKGIFNGIDAVVLATGNDFRAVEACGHTHAASSGRYSSLTYLEESDTHFKYVLEIPMALGVVGGLTGLHPMVKRSLEMLGNPSAPELMQIAACLGLANNFGALRSLTTTGIQKGHMKMHLLNILNHFAATDAEKVLALEHFKTEKVSFSAVRSLLETMRGASIS